MKKLLAVSLPLISISLALYIFPINVYASFSIYGVTLGENFQNAQSEVLQRAKNGKYNCSYGSAKYTLTNTIARSTYSCVRENNRFNLLLGYSAKTQAVDHIKFESNPGYNILYSNLYLDIVKKFGGPTNVTEWTAAGNQKNYYIYWLVNGGKILPLQSVPLASKSCVNQTNGWSGERYLRILPCGVLYRASATLNSNGTIYQYGLHARDTDAMQASKAYLVDVAKQKAIQRQKAIQAESEKAKPSL